jgi:hypothetical protein
MLSLYGPAQVIVVQDEQESAAAPGTKPLSVHQELTRAIDGGDQGAPGSNASRTRLTFYECSVHG